MSSLPRPDLPPAPPRPRRALHELHHRAGWPSLRTLAREAGVSTHHRLQDLLLPGAPHLGHPRAPRRGHGRRHHHLPRPLARRHLAPPTAPAPRTPRIAGRTARARRRTTPPRVRQRPPPRHRRGRHRQDHAGHRRRAGQRDLRRHRPLPAAVDRGPADAAGRRAAPGPRRRGHPLVGRRPRDAVPPTSSGALALLLPELEPPADAGRTTSRASACSPRSPPRSPRWAIVRSLAILLEDLHWADSSTLDVLEHLLAHVPSARVVGTFRTADPDIPATTLDRLARVRLVAGPQCLDLAPLDVDRHPRAAEPRRWVVPRHRSSSTRSTAGPAGTRSSPPSWPPPDRRRSRWGSPACSTTGCASSDRTAGRSPGRWASPIAPCSRPSLAEATGLTLDRVLTVLHQLSDQWLLAPPDGSPTVGLRHPLIAEAIRRRLAPGEAGMQHRRVAAALAARARRRAGRDRPPLARGRRPASTRSSGAARPPSARRPASPPARRWTTGPGSWSCGRRSTSRPSG